MNAPATYTIQAIHLPSRIRLKSFAALYEEKPSFESSRELVYKQGEQSYLFIYNYGSIVFFNIHESLRPKIIEKLHLSQTQTPAPSSETISENFLVEQLPQLENNALHEIGFNKVRLKDLTDEKIKLICRVIAESTALDYFENAVEDLLIKSQKISNNLKETGKPLMSIDAMTRYIGICLSTKQDIIADFYIVDAPDETWEDQVLSKLYEDVKFLFEIETRYKVLEYKLKLIQEAVDVVADLLKFRRQTYLEVIIIALIAIEVLWLVIKVLVPSLANLPG